MRIAWLCLLSFGCALRPNDAPPAPAAARGAATIAGERADAGDEEAGCATTADCALTRVPPGGCCPMLCNPRAVTRQRADALEAAIPTCHKGRECPEPLCRPPAGEMTAACVAGRCVAKSEGLPR